MAADSPCDQGEFLCDVGLLSVMAGIVVAFLCACACFCLLCGRLWHWRPPRCGQFHIESIGRTCSYQVEDKAETQKTHIVWEIDPEVLAGFQSVTDSGVTALQSESGDVRGDCAATGTSGTLCREDASSPSESCSIASESSSSSPDPKGHQLVLRSHRHLSSDGAAVNVHPAYVHGAEVEYYSCTHRCWVRGLVTLDFLDRHVDGCWNTDAVVYGVRLFRSHQYRIHVALHHLRRPMETGQVIGSVPPSTEPMESSNGQEHAVQQNGALVRVGSERERSDSASVIKQAVLPREHPGVCGFSLPSGKVSEKTSRKSRNFFPRGLPSFGTTPTETMLLAHCVVDQGFGRSRSTGMLTLSWAR